MVLKVTFSQLGLVEEKVEDLPLVLFHSHLPVLKFGCEAVIVMFFYLNEMSGTLNETLP